MPNNDTSTDELDNLIQTLGGICHEHYLGCGKNVTAPDGFEYAYDNELVNLLDAPDVKAAITAWADRRVAEAYEFSRAAVMASPVSVSGRHIGGTPGGMPHVEDRQVDVHGPNKLPVYATTYAMRDFVLDQIDQKLAALKKEVQKHE